MLEQFAHPCPLYVPFGQDVQFTEPVALAKVLAAQDEHCVALLTELYWPSPHGEHVPELTYVPGKHTVGGARTQHGSSTARRRAATCFRGAIWV